MRTGEGGARTQRLRRKGLPFQKAEFQDTRNPEMATPGVTGVEAAFPTGDGQAGSPPPCRPESSTGLPTTPAARPPLPGLDEHGGHAGRGVQDLVDLHLRPAVHAVPLPRVAR